MFKEKIKHWLSKGTPWVWLNAGAIAISMVMVFGLLGLIAYKGMVHFWPKPIMHAEYQPSGESSSTVIGEISERELVDANRVKALGVFVPEGVDEIERYLIKTGNREVLGSDFNWVLARDLSNIRFPDEVMVLERREWGNFYGYLVSVNESDQPVAKGVEAWGALQARIARVDELNEKIDAIERGKIGKINYRMEQLRLKERRYELDGQLTEEHRRAIKADREALTAEYAGLEAQLGELYRALRRDSLTAKSMEGGEHQIMLSEVVRAIQPNALSLPEKFAYYAAHFFEFVTAEPREANTEGGVFPAIFGTVMMVMLMSAFVTPFGVVAAIYLREYAKQGTLTRIIRIAVNNLAGVPSIVYGVFGLGFFVYFLGGNIDDLFYPEASPAPVFGTPGLLWASITLALLTVPVVIVATEEGLARIPRSVREGSLALGATKFETLCKVIIPMASPAMMTGLILAIARAAGEVAPLMLVGVVKLAPTLPLDGNFPFLHLERKFMHLGFHIYDVGFQSPNVEAARPLVFASAFLLVIVIAALNLSAVMLRNRLRERYKALES